MRRGRVSKVCVVSALALLAVVCFGTGAQAQGALNITTVPPTTPATSFPGIMFDLTAGTIPLRIHRLGVAGASAQTADVEIWRRPGGMSSVYPPAASGDFVNPGWVFMGFAPTTFTVANGIAQIPLDLNLQVPANTTFGFAVIARTGGNALRYHSGTWNAPYTHGNSDLTLYMRGIGGSYLATPSAGMCSMTPNSFPRAFCGTVWYDYDQLPGQNAEVTTARLAGDGIPALGNNIVEGVIRNNGTTALDNHVFGLQYSTDNGTNWSATQNFSFPSFPPLTNQTCTFPAPMAWNITAAGQVTLQVRLTAPVGAGTVMASRTYTPDADITSVSVNPFTPPPLNAPITVSVTVQNNGTFNLNGVPLSCSFTIDGVNYTSQQFVPTTLATTNSTQTFQFNSPLVVTTPGTYTLTVVNFPGVNGDPDPLDQGTYPLDEIGFPVAIYGTGTTTASGGVPLYRLTGSNSTSSHSFAQMLYLASDLPALPVGSRIENLSFFKTNTATTVAPFTHKMRVWLRNTTETVYAAATTYGPATTAGTLVYENNAWTLPPDIGWMQLGPFDPQNSFIYTGGSLEVTVEWNCWSQGGATTDAPSFRYNAIATSDNRGRGQNITISPVTTTQSISLVGLSSGIRRPHIRFEYSPISTADLDVVGATFGTTPAANGPSVGSNTVNAVIRHLGTQAFTGAFDVGYSTDGGQNWVSQNFTASGLTSAGALQTVTFTQPWLVPAMGAHELRLRILPVVSGDPDTTDTLTLTYVPDVDLTEASIAQVTSITAPATVTATLVNSGGINLNGIGIPLQYSVNGGPYTAPETFTPTTLAPGGTQTYTFTTQHSILLQGAHTVTVRVATPLAGDPDPVDSVQGYDPYLGFAISQFGTGTNAAGSSPPLYRLSNVSTNDNSIYQMLYTAAQVNLPAGSVIRGLSFNKGNDGASVADEVMQVWLNNLPSTTLTYTGAATYATITTGATLVYDSTTHRTPATIGWIPFGEFNETTPFVYTGGNLEIIVASSIDHVTNPVKCTNLYAWLADAITQDSRGRAYVGITLNSGTSSLSLNGSLSGTRRPHLRIHHQPGNVPAITSSMDLGMAEEGVPFSATLAAVGGSGGPAYTWAIAGGALPAGLSINPTTGAITGSASPLTSRPEPYYFVVSATDASGTGTRTFTMKVKELTLGTPSGRLPDAEVSVAYSTTIAASGGGIGKTFTVTSGVLPAGLTLNTSNGQITGTPTVAAIQLGGHRFTVTVTSGTASVQGEYHLVVLPPVQSFGTGTTNAEGGPPVNRTTSGTLVDYSLYAMMYTPAQLPGLASGMVVSSLAFYKESTGASTGDDILRVWLRNTTSHAYRGGVTVSQWTHGATLVADYSNYRFPATIGWIDFGPFNTGNAFVYEGANLEILVEYNSYATPGVGATGGFFWRYDAISPNDNRGMGYAPTSDFLPLPETSALGLNSNNSGARRPHLQITAFAPSLPVVAGGQPAPADEGVVYSHALAALGGNGGPYTWAIASGALPSGLTLNPATGVISGTPAANTRSANPYMFTVSATDSAGTGFRTMTVTVRQFGIATPAGMLPDAIANSPYSETIVAAGGAAPRTWMVTAGALPVGLTLNPTTGVISGTPTLVNVTGNPIEFTVTVTDGTSTALSAAYRITVLGPFYEYGQLSTVAPNSGITVPPMVRNSATNTTDVSLYQMLYVREDLAGLPIGAVIQGISFLKDGYGQSLGDDILRIWLRNTEERVYYSSKTYADWTAGAMPMADHSNFRMPPVDGWVSFGPFNTGNTFVYTGGSVEVSIEYNALATPIPADNLFGFRNNVIAVDNRGRGFSSTAAPTATSVVALNGVSSGVRRSLMRVHYFPPLTPKIASDAPPPADEGIAYSHQPVATGGNGGPWTWSVSTGSLPAGLTLNPATGAITGTPAADTRSQLPYFFTLSATDGTGTGTFATSITVRPLAVVAGTVTLPPAAVGVAYWARIGVVGGAAVPRVFSLASGALPAGLVLNTATGEITGSPTLAAASTTPYTFTVQVTDGTSAAGTVVTMLVNDGVIEFGTGTASAASVPPIIRASATTTVDVSVTQFLYYASDLQSLPAGSLLSSIAFNKTNDGASVAAEHTLQIWLRNTSQEQYFDSPAFQDLTAGATLVYDDTAFAMPATIGWITLPFNTASPFIYAGGNLEVIVHFDCSASTVNPTTNSFNWRYDVIPVADHRGRGITASVPIAPVTLVTVNGQNSGIRRPHVQFGVGSNAPTDLDLGRVTFGAAGTSTPVIGSNAVHVEVRNTGSTPYSGPVVVEYSGNGGPWVSQSFTLSGATGIGSASVFSFTTPWTITGTAAALQVRISPAVTGDPDAQDLLDLTYPADLDVEAVGLATGGDPVFGNNTVTVTVANRGVMALAGQNFGLQFSSNGGTTWSAPESFPATLVALPGMSSVYTFTAPLVVSTVSNMTLVARLAPAPAGDPDATNEFSRLYLASGGAFEVLTGSFEIPSTVGLPAAGSNGYPFNTVWEDQRLEAIYLASELTAAGLYAGALITGMQLKCAQLPGMEVQNFRIRIQNTSLSQHSLVAYTPSGFTDCFGPTTIPLTDFTVGGWVRFPFHTTYTWDGVSNLKVDFSTDGAAFVSGGGCFLRETPGQWRSIVGYEDSATSFPFNTGMLQLIPKTNVPSLKVEFPVASNPGILVSRAGIIPDGNVDDLADSLTATIQVPLVYTVRNYGTSSTLNVTSVNITGAVNCTAVLTTGVGGPIAPGLTGSMTISVTPGGGPYSFNVELVNNASFAANQSYTFTVQGTGYVNNAPVIEAPVPAVTGRVLITEVAVNVAQAGGWSFFELTNFGGTPVDVTGWEVFIWDGTGIAPFTATGAPLTALGSLPPGIAYVIGESTPGIYLPNVFSINPPYNWSWTSGSGGVMVRDALGNVVDCVFWGLATPATITAPISIGSNWVGTNAPAIAVGVPIWRITLNDTNTSADWISGPSLSVGQANAPYWTLPRARPNASVAANGANYELVTYTGESLLTFLRATDADGSRQSLTLTAAHTGGTLSPQQAGFSTIFPAAAANGSSPRVLVLDGTAVQPGTVVFTVTAADDSNLPLNHSYQLTVRIDSAARVEAMQVDSPYQRPNGRRDLFRGGTVPVDITLSNPNPFPVTVHSVNVAIRAKAGNTLLAAVPAAVIGGPVTLAANATNVMAEVSMTVPAGTPGTNGQAVVVSLTGGTASDPASATNTIGVLIYSGTDELDLRNGPVPAPMVIGFTSLLPAVETVPYNHNLVVTGGSGSYTWSLSPASTLPIGLTMGTAGSELLPASIQGVPDNGTSNGSPYQLTMTVSEGTYQRELAMTLTVSTSVPLNFPTVALANGEEFVPYTMTTPFTATGGSLIYTFSVDPTSASPLPAGLSLNPVTGVISGTPAAGTQGSHAITFMVNDGQSTLVQTVSLTIAPHPLQWRGTTLPPAEVTVAYSHSLDAIGGTGARIYSYAPGTAQQLPAGLTFAQATGLITGTPAASAVGTYAITFRVTDSLNAFVDQAFSLSVSLPPPLAISATPLAYGEVGTPLNQAIQATGGSRNYTFTVASTGDTLPAGLTLLASGAFAGTPAYGQDGRYSLDVTVSDGFGTASRTVVLAILADGSSGLVVTELDTAMNYIELTNAGDLPVDVSAWTIRVWADGTTPVAFPFHTLPGASLAVPGETISLSVGGTPGGTWPNYNLGGSWTATNASNLAVQLLDIHGNTIDFIRFGTVSVAALLDEANQPLTLPAALATRPAAATNAANRSLGAFGFATGAAGTPGQYNPDLPAMALALVKDVVRPAQENQAYRDFVTATGGLKPYAWSVVSPAAAWLQINAQTGELTGTPPAASAGSVLADVTVTDATTASVTVTVNIPILAATAVAGVTFTVGPGEGQSFEGTVISVPVTMTRAAGSIAVHSYSFVVTVPAATSAELDVLRVLPGPAALAAGRSVVGVDLGGGRVFVGDFNPDSSTTPVADGVVAIIQFIVPEDDSVMAPTGTYDLGITDLGVNTGPVTELAAGVAGQIILSNFKPQDVNRDTAIDVVDVQFTVNLILQIFTEQYPGQGDANEDNTVDVVDVQTIVNCILLGGC